MALRETQAVPFTHHRRALDTAELVGGQPADLGQHLEVRSGLAHDALLDDGVTVDDRGHRVRRRQGSGNGAKTMRQAITLAGAGDAHHLQLDRALRVQLLVQRADQFLVRMLDDGGHHGGRDSAFTGLGDGGAVDHRRGLGIYPEAGNQQIDMAGHRALAQLAGEPAHLRIGHVLEVQGTQKVVDPQ